MGTISSKTNKKPQVVATASKSVPRAAPTSTASVTASASSATSVSSILRDRVNKGGERIWLFDHFRDLPFQAVAQALSRLCRSGEIRRISKGVYYKYRMTSLGESKPSPMELQKIVTEFHFVFSSGVAAANMLGFTTQNSARVELSTTAQSLPRKLLGEHTIVHARRPKAWESLNQEDAAILEFLRSRGMLSELTPSKTVEKLLELLMNKARFQRLLKVASTEPPRVRAMLGAIGEQLNMTRKVLYTLRTSLNPLSTYDFGLLTALKHAQDWQAT